MTEAEKLGIFVLVLIGLYFLNHIVMDFVLSN
jgi:hypothetical protein